MTERQEALEAAYESSRNRLKLPKDKFMDAFGSWIVCPVRVSGAIVGGVLLKGNEVHVAVSKSSEGRWLSRSLIRRVLGNLISRYGVAVTSVMKDNERGQRFVERLGFQRVGEKEGTIGYELRQLHF